MKSLFDQTSVKNMELKNRFVRSATWEGLSDDDGHINKNIMDVYEDLCKGDIGLIITSYAYITKDEKPNFGMLGIYDDSFIDEYSKLVKMVHSYGTKIIMQIVYGGSNTSYDVGSRVIWGPSAIKHLKTGTLPKEMTKEEIKLLINYFTDAALRCKEAGFDGIQIHGAHGYLLSQWLDPYHNRRTDEYGGSIENRARIIIEVYKAIREKVGEDYHISIKINSSDFRDGGANFEDCKYVLTELDKLGIDSAEISGGDFRGFKGEAFFREYAEELSDILSCPVILVGGNRSAKNMNDILNNTNIEYFSMSRPLICEPDLVSKFKNDIEYASKCIGCNQCYKNNKICALHE